MKKGICSVLILLLFASTVLVNAQGKLGLVGKIFNKKEANVLFGKVIGSVQIKVSDLNQAIAQANDYIFFTVKNGQAVVTNEKRKPLTQDSFSAVLKADEPMILFSKSVLQDFLQKTGLSGTQPNVSSAGVTTASAGVITVEVRAGVTTFTSGDYTLEMAMMCPPICF